MGTLLDIKGNLIDEGDILIDENLNLGLVRNIDNKLYMVEGPETDRIYYEFKLTKRFISQNDILLVAKRGDEDYSIVSKVFQYEKELEEVMIRDNNIRDDINVLTEKLNGNYEYDDTKVSQSEGEKMALKYFERIQLNLKLKENELYKYCMCRHTLTDNINALKEYVNNIMLYKFYKKP